MLFFSSLLIFFSLSITIFKYLNFPGPFEIFVTFNYLKYRTLYINLMASLSIIGDSLPAAFLVVIMTSIGINNEIEDQESNDAQSGMFDTISIDLIK